MHVRVSQKGRERGSKEPREQREALDGATDSQHVVVFATVGEQTSRRSVRLHLCAVYCSAKAFMKKSIRDARGSDDSKRCRKSTPA